MINQEFLASLASVIKEHRKISGLSRIELAQLAGVSKTVIFDIEHGKVTIRLNTICKILDVLNISLQLTSPILANNLNSKALN